MPALNKYTEKGDLHPLEAIHDKLVQNTIIASLKAIEGHALFGCIAIGLLQMIALLFFTGIDSGHFRWLRTKTNVVPSEATIADYMRKTIFRLSHKTTNFYIIRLIQDK